ncbi:hypothetical protein [uncultured Bacteroides sp.]|uniref:hypothetical protein n=1 Tax=uncultured Bacteroides sp. TaxID=162156 RepID=UPI002AABE84A|nr:hypothetical protein [uncultured Bacteroides sp.]
MEITQKNRNSIFSILVKKDDSHVMHLGTGFFIGLKGLFFTCGHTFRKNEAYIDELFIAFPQSKSELYKIKSLYYKSFEIYKQKGPEYHDAAIGIIDYDNSDFLVFNRKRPKNKSTLFAIGIKNDSPTKLHPLNGNKADLSLLKLVPTKLTVDLLQKALISDLLNDYKLPREDVAPERFFNNCVEMTGVLEKGESGCPILDNKGLVSGTFIAYNEQANSSAMILSKHCTKAIRYNTYYHYDIYQDLTLR